MTRRISLFFGLLFLLTSLNRQGAYAQNTGSIEGQIRDKTTQQEVIGATVQVIGTNLGAVSDVSGHFIISGLASGTYSLKISATGYKAIVRSDVRIGTTQSTKLTIELSIDAYEQQEVVVCATRTFSQSEDTRVSSNELSQEEIRRAPGAIEDISRMVQILPGVAFGSDARSDIIARGGNPIENFTMIDGIEVPNINHYSNQGGSAGQIGMINVDFLNDVNFSAGGFGAKYGDKLSSIMDIKYRDGDKQHYRGKLDLGIAGFGGIIECPIQPEKSSFLLSVRRSYVDLIASAIGLSTVPRYWNFNAKATFELTPQHHLEFIGLGGIDEVDFKDYSSTEADALTNTNFKHNGWQYVIGLSHKWLLDKNTFLRTSVSSNMYHYKLSVDSVSVDANRNELNRTREYTNTSADREPIAVRMDFSHRFSPKDLVEVGINAKKIRNTSDIYVKAGTDAPGTNPDEFISITADAVKFGAYSQYTRNLTSKLSATAGIRYDYFSYIQAKNAVSPRLSLSYEITDNLRFNASGGLYQQAPSLIWLVADESNRQTKFIKTYQAVTGVEFFPQEDLKLSVEVYAKEYRDYPVSVEHPQYVYSSAGAFDEDSFEAIRSGSKGYSRGIELFLHKKLTDRLYGIINYGYSVIKFTDGLGTERASAFDYRNNFTITGGYKLTDALEVSAKFRFAGGRPYTPFDLQASESRNRGVFDYTRVNSVRSDDYKRLDVRGDYRVGMLGWNVLFFVDLQNVLDIKNVEQIAWNNKLKRPDRTLQWGFLPTAGIKAEF